MTSNSRLTQNAEYVLLEEVTAFDLAMNSFEPGEGYPAEYVIGPKGSTVKAIQGADEDADDLWVEVTGFANDPEAAGWVPRSHLAQIDSSGARS